MGYVINDECTECGVCVEECPVEAISKVGERYFIDPDKCTECGTCIEICPTGAVSESE